MRIIPILLIENRRLVKGVNFKSHQYVGDPVNAIRLFNEFEVDELCIIDIGATKENYIDFDYISDLSSECFMPLTYIGGVNTISQAKNLFSLGVEKVGVNSLASTNPRNIEQFIEYFGGQSIVVGIDVEKNIFGKYRIKNGLNCFKSIEVFIDYLNNIEIGEILLTSVNKEGTLSGIDVDLVNYFQKLVTVPLIYSGGIGSLNDFNICRDLNLEAVGVGSYFIYSGPHKGVLINYNIL